MAEVFMYLCERCEDLTENKPDHRGRVRCQDCGGHAAADTGVDNLEQRAEMPAPVSPPSWWGGDYA